MHGPGVQWVRYGTLQMCVLHFLMRVLLVVPVARARARARAPPSPLTCECCGDGAENSSHDIRVHP